MTPENKALLARMNKARDFPAHTCPASRHAAMIAEHLAKGKPYPMLREEPEHVAGTIASVVASLWEARQALAQARAEALEENKELLLDCQSVLSYVDFYGLYPEGSLGFADVKSCLDKLDRALHTNEGG